ncbi:MAG: hypothetical protein V4687_04675 [Bacteroidota bacterium]
MKTSNKLLIAFGLALILIPIVTIAFVSRVYFEKGTYSNKKEVHDTFGALPKDMEAIAIGKAFNTVNIEGNNQVHLVIKLVEDKTYGVKFSNEFKGLVSASVDESGQLRIVLQKAQKENVNFARISVYGMGITKVAVNNGRGISLTAKTDSLDLKLSNTGSAHFDPDANIGKLTITTEHVDDITFRETATKSVFLNLNGTNVRSDMSSFDQLSIYAAGKSKIELNGGYGDRIEKVIKHLTLNTLGNAEVKIFNMQVDNCSGRFSDSTKVEMPAVNINQMYKTKK